MNLGACVSQTGFIALVQGEAAQRLSLALAFSIEQRLATQHLDLFSRLHRQCELMQAHTATSSEKMQHSITGFFSIQLTEIESGAKLRVLEGEVIWEPVKKGQPRGVHVMKPESYNRHKTSQHYKTDLDLEAYMESPAGRCGGCCYVRRLVSEAPAGDSSVATASMIAEAKQNLERVHVLGLLEEFEDFLRRLGDVLGRRLYVGHLNRNPAPRAARDPQLDETTLRRIAALCEPDREIYEHARYLLRLSVE